MATKPTKKALTPEQELARTAAREAREEAQAEVQAATAARTVTLIAEDGELCPFLSPMTFAASDFKDTGALARAISFPAFGVRLPDADGTEHETITEVITGATLADADGKLIGTAKLAKPVTLGAEFVTIKAGALTFAAV